MRKVSTLLIFMAMLLVCMYADAQTYSLDDCIRIATESNPDLQNSRLDVVSAEFRIKEVKSALKPTINMNGQLTYYNDLPSQYAPASAFGGPEGEYTKMTLSMAQTTSASIQMNQNLYNQSVLTGVKAAKVVREASALQVELTRETIVYNVTSTYYSIQVLNDNLALLAENISNLERTVRIDSILKENELVSGNVHNRMMINLENLRNQYENQKLLLDKNISLLKYLMNLSPDASLTVAPFDYSELVTIPQEGDISARPDIRLQQANIRLSQLDKKSIVAGYYPTLSNTSSFGYTSYYDELKPFRQINNDWIKTSYFALSLKIPVFDGSMKHNQARQKEIAIQKNINTLSRMKNNADKEIQDATNNYRTNTNLFINNKKSLELAQQLFESASSEYENGITSITDFLNAQNDLSNARTNYSAALLNLKLAELSLKKANGTLTRQ
jgi:outer membrane protein